VTGIQDWLAQVGLDKYAAILQEHDITLEVLPDLTPPDIDRLDLPTGPRRRLMVALQALEAERRSRGSHPPVDAKSAYPSRAPEAERRHLTVMFCDLVGSVALSARLDPEELQELMRSYCHVAGQVVAEYDGHLAQSRGDGLFVYFGWPIAHEDDAERCARAALAIIDAIKSIDVQPRLAVRIGIATGTVVVGAVPGSTNPEDRLAVGETPNLAARLQGLAHPDEIVIAPSTRQLLGSGFELADLGSHSLKGLDEPVQAWRVLRMTEAASRFEARQRGHLTPLVGREQELELLLERQRHASDGEGQVVLLCGEPGIGKSRVLNELHRRLSGQGVQAQRLQCLPYYVNSAFWPAVDHFSRVLKLAQDESTNAKLDKLEAFAIEGYGRPLDDVRLLASLLSIPFEARYGPVGLNPQRRKEETQRALVDLAVAVARAQPSVTLFEDIHWADESTLEVLDLLIDRVKDAPLVIVLTHRPEFQNRWTHHGHVCAINLTKLTSSQCGSMISQLAGARHLPEGLVGRIVDKASGIPLFVEELTKSILESGDLDGSDDGLEIAGGERSIRIPTSLQDSLMARLDRYLPGKEAAQVAAVIGQVFSYELLSAVTPISNVLLNRGLEHLLNAGLILRRGGASDGTYAFKHALIQDAAYESLLKRKRQQMHAEIARTIEERFPSMTEAEPEVLAHHYTGAELFARGATYWLTAGRNALGRSAAKDAIGHLEKGLEAIGRMPASETRDRMELECRVLLSTGWEAYGGWASEHLPKVLTPALALAKATRQPKLLARTSWGLWVQRMSVGPVAESLVLAEALLRSGEEMGDEELLLVGHMAVMVTNFWHGNIIEVERHARAILAKYVRERHGEIVKSMNHDPKTLAGIYLSLALWMLGYPDQGVAIVDERDAHARRIGHPFDTGFALTLGTWIFHYRREPERQCAHNEELHRLARDTDLPFLSAILAPFLVTGMSLAQQGQLSEGIEHMQRGIQFWEAAGAKTTTPLVRARLGEAIALSGDVEGGIAHIDAMLEQIYTPGWQERGHLAEILRLKGWMLTLRGDSEGAERNYRDSLDWAREQQAKSWELRTATSLARLWHAQGKAREAYELLAPVYAWFTEGFDTRDLIEAKKLIAELAT
jgi:class 3 adenylate cyclase